VRAEPIIFLLVTAGCVFVYALHLRYRRRELQHRERLAAIEKGVALPELTDLESGPRPYLLRGMIWLFSGVALTVFLSGISVTTHRTKPVEQRVMEARLIEQAGGTPEQIRQVQNDTNPQEILPLAFSLVGLIPVGVGTAYLIFYRAETARTRQ
jgi:hypothetical protein